MRIVFIGSVEFSEKALRRLLECKADVVGALTKKDSVFNTDFCDLSKICRKHAIPFKYVKNINAGENVAWIRKCRPDVVFCFGFSQILGKDILRIAPMGVVGFHPAMLPVNRGRHPLVWALALGLKRTAATFFFMDEGADSGDILSQEEIDVTETDNARTLYRKVTDSALHQMETFFPRLLRKEFRRIPQDASKATYWRKRVPKDGELDFRMGKKALYNLVRALTHPYAGAHVSYKGNVIKVWEAEGAYAGVRNDEPGKVLDVSGAEILVKCYDGALLLKKHEFKILPKRGEYLL